MSMYRNELPQLNGMMCITDGGMETDLVFNHNVDLPEFAAYVLLRKKSGPVFGSYSHCHYPSAMRISPDD